MDIKEIKMYDLDFTKCKLWQSRTDRYTGNVARITIEYRDNQQSYRLATRNKQTFIKLFRSCFSNQVDEFYKTALNSADTLFYFKNQINNNEKYEELLYGRILLRITGGSTKTTTATIGDSEISTVGIKNTVDNLVKSYLYYSVITGFDKKLYLDELEDSKITSKVILESFEEGPYSLIVTDDNFKFDSGKTYSALFRYPELDNIAFRIGLEGKELSDMINATNELSFTTEHYNNWVKLKQYYSKSITNIAEKILSTSKDDPRIIHDKKDKYVILTRDILNEVLYDIPNDYSFGAETVSDVESALDKAKLLGFNIQEYYGHLSYKFYALSKENGTRIITPYQLNMKY